MLNYYEETMPLETNEDEYKKYLIDENLPLFDKLNVIIKKGYPVQRQALLNSLNIYINETLFKPLIEYIIAEIVTWDIETRVLFPRSLHNILINCLSSIDVNLFNIIFKHMILSISLGNEKLSKEYIYYFDKIIEKYTVLFNNGETFPYQIKDDIFEIIVSLGKFGQSPENIRLCCYLSSCMCRLVGHVEENENIQKMFKRICLLFGDLEKITERQISRELRYLIPIFKEKIMEKSDIIKAIKSYINHDWDHAIQSTTIVSLLINFEFINDEMKELIYEKITEIFEDVNYEEEHKNNIIDTFINTLYNLCVKYDERKKGKKIKSYNDFDLKDPINNIFKMNFLNNLLNKDKVEPLLIVNFDKINTILKHSSFFDDNNDNKLNFLYNYNCEEGTCIEIIFLKIFSKIFQKNSNNIINIEEEAAPTNENMNENLIRLFVINLYKIIPCLNNIRYARYLCEKISNIFKKDYIILVLKIFEKEFSSNNYSKNHNYLYRLLYCLLEKGYKNIISINSNSYSNKNSISNSNIIGNNSNIFLLNENNYYFKSFQNILESLFSLNKSSSDLITYQIHVLLAKTFQKIIKLIYKYYKPFSQSYKDKVNIDKLYDELFNSYLLHIIKNDEIGNHIRTEYINVIPYLILYGKNRQDYYNFLEDEILKSKKFYMRRCSIQFVEKCLNMYSFKLFLKFNFMEIIYYLINDENNIISSSIMEKILLFHKKIKFYSNSTLDKIYSIISEMDNQNKNSDSLKDFDIEKDRIIKKLMNLYNNKNEKNKNFYGLLQEQEQKEENEIKKIKIKEAKHIKKENVIFGKTYQNISLIITVNYENKNSNGDKIESENENKNEKVNVSRNDDLLKLNMSSLKEKSSRRKILEKSISGIIPNINTKISSKKYLPKLKQYRRKNSCDNSRPFHLNASNNINNNDNQIVNKSINLSKIMVIIKDKTPEKRNQLRSINKRLPSSSSSKMKETFSINTNNSTNIKPKHLLLIQNKLNTNILIEDTNDKSLRMINLNGVNKGSLLSNIIGYSGKDFFREIIKNEIKKNNINKGNKINNSCKKVMTYLKNGIKGMKMKRDLKNKVILNAKISEGNKTTK